MWNHISYGKFWYLGQCHWHAKLHIIGTVYCQSFHNIHHWHMLCQWLVPCIHHWHAIQWKPCQASTSLVLSLLQWLDGEFPPDAYWVYHSTHPMLVTILVSRLIVVCLGTMVLNATLKMVQPWYCVLYIQPCKDVGMCTIELWP